MHDQRRHLETGLSKKPPLESGTFYQRTLGNRTTIIVSVRSHDYDVGENLVPPYWRSEICHMTPRVL